MTWAIRGLVQPSASKSLTLLRFLSVGMCGGRPRLPQLSGIGSPSRSKRPSKSSVIGKKIPPWVGVRSGRAGVVEIRPPPLTPHDRPAAGTSPNDVRRGAVRAAPAPAADGGGRAWRKPNLNSARRRASRSAASARSTEALRCFIEASAIHTLIRQRPPTPSCRGHSPYCGENSEPGRRITESLTSNPRVREQPGSQAVIRRHHQEGLLLEVKQTQSARKRTWGLNVGCWG